MTSTKSRKLFLALAIPALLFVVVTTQSCARQSPRDIETRIAHAENEAWNKGNVGLLDEIYASNCVLHVGTFMRLEGNQGLKQMIEMFRNEMPDRSFQIDEISSSGNTITERYTWQGTHTKTGTKVRVSGCVVYHLENGKIVEAWNYEDMYGLYQQLGLDISQSLFE